MSKLLKSMVSCTTDLGTEAGFTSVGPLDSNLLFPHLWNLDADAEDGVEAASTVLTMEHTLPIAGVLHIVDNVVHHMADTVQAFPQIRRQIDALSLLLKRSFTRQRLIATCFQPCIALSSWIPLLNSFRAALIDWRWGVLTTVVRDILDLEVALRSGWDVRKVNLQDQHLLANAQQNSNAQHDERRGADPQVVDGAIRSKFFWQYLHMLELVSTFMQQLSAWHEGRPCHGPFGLDVDGFDVAGYRNLGSRRSGGVKAALCALQGRRAPE
jgi:hypothetical protein